MEFKVIAKQTGYYNHIRRREDAVFMMDEKDFVKVSDVENKKMLDGRIILKGDSEEVILPRWVRLAKDQESKISGKQKPKPKKEVVELEDEVI